MMWWNNNGMGWGTWALMIGGTLVVWAVVAVAGIAIFRGVRKGQAGGSTAATPAQILDERFARGDIDIDEYHARQEALRTVR
jgi:putative membrane protein